MPTAEFLPANAAKAPLTSRHFASCKSREIHYIYASKAFAGSFFVLIV